MIKFHNMNNNWTFESKGCPYYRHPLYKLIIRNDLNKRAFYMHIRPHGSS